MVTVLMLFPYRFKYSVGVDYRYVSCVQRRKVGVRTRVTVVLYGSACQFRVGILFFAFVLGIGPHADPSVTMTPAIFVLYTLCVQIVKTYGEAHARAMVHTPTCTFRSVCIIRRRVLSCVHTDFVWTKKPCTWGLCCHTTTGEL